MAVRLGRLHFLGSRPGAHRSLHGGGASRCGVSFLAQVGRTEIAFERAAPPPPKPREMAPALFLGRPSADAVDRAG